jgi:hypothetical protein
MASGIRLQAPFLRSETSNRPKGGSWNKKNFGISR